VSFIKIKGVSDIFPNFKGVYCNFPLIYIYIYLLSGEEEIQIRDVVLETKRNVLFA
jgi:hypothetical protein